MKSFKISFECVLNNSSKLCCEVCWETT